MTGPPPGPSADRSPSRQGGGRAQPDARVSDHERNEVVDHLRRFCADGFLTLDEFSDRVGTALGSTTRGELELVTADLPAADAPVPEVQRRRQVTTFVLSIMGGNERKGRWRPGERVTAVAIMGGCALDLRQAEIGGEEITITAVAVMGGIDVVVPEGVSVELTGLPIMGGKDLKVADVPRTPGTPLIRVRAFPVMGGVSVRSRPPREVEQARREARRRDRDEARRARGVRPRRPRPDDRRRAPSSPVEAPPAGGALPEGTVTVLFTDIEAFTTLNERLGDDAAHVVLMQHHEIVRRSLAACGGFEVKCQGDGFMLAFSGARSALRCAVSIQRELDRFNDEHPDIELRVRMGLHAGDVVRDGQDVGGRPVILASRIADEAVGGEVLASSLVRELAESCGEFEFGDERRTELKGLAGRHTMVPVHW